MIPAIIETFRTKSKRAKMNFAKLNLIYLAFELKIPDIILPYEKKKSSSSTNIQKDNKWLEATIVSRKLSGVNANSLLYTKHPIRY